MRILLARSGFLGDVVLTTSAVAGVRRKYPSAEIHYATWRQCIEILSLTPHLSDIKCPGFYMMSDYDLWIDFRHESLIDEYPETYWGKLHAMQCAEKKLLDWGSMTNFRPKLYIGPDDLVEKESDQKICAINVFSANGVNWRLWGFDKWTELVSNLNKMGYKTVQLGGDNDPKIENVNVQLCGSTRLAQVAGVLAVSDLAIGIDSFMMHAAHADKYVRDVENDTIEKISGATPSVLVCGPVPWQCVVPRDAPCVPVCDYPDCDGACNHSYPTQQLPICEFENSCMRKLSIEKVLSTVEEVHV